MASDYVRFEVFLPTRFRGIDGKERAVAGSDIQDFTKEIYNRFGGYTEANPVASPPFKGWWNSKGVVSIDFTISLFVLIDLRRQDEAVQFFEEWKRRLEAQLNQEVILIYYYPLKVFGDL